MSKFKEKLASISMKNLNNQRKLKRSIKKIAEIEALKQVGDQNIGYAIKETIRQEICYYGVLLEYVESKGQNINFLSEKLETNTGDIELFNIMMDIYLQPDYEFSHDTFDLLNEQGFAVGQYDNDAKEYIENKARNLDSIANTEDIINDFKEAIKNAKETVNSWD